MSESAMQTRSRVKQVSWEKVSFQAANVQEHVHVRCIGRIEGQPARGYGFISKVFKCR